MVEDFILILFRYQSSKRFYHNESLNLNKFKFKEFQLEVVIEFLSQTNLECLIIRSVSNKHYQFEIPNKLGKQNNRRK